MKLNKKKIKKEQIYTTGITFFLLLTPISISITTSIEPSSITNHLHQEITLTVNADSNKGRFTVNTGFLHGADENEHE